MSASKPPPGVEVMTTKARTVRPQPIDWIWRGRIAYGKLTVVAGDPGAGKGTVAADLCARLSVARAWPDGAPTPLCKSAHLSGEDDPADTQIPRLMVAGADLDQVELVGMVETLERESRRIDLSAEGEAELLVGSMAAREVRVIVIDPASSYLGAETNSWRDSDMRRILDPLAEAAARHHVAIIIVAHLTKASGNRALYRVGGSIATMAAARFGFLIAAHPRDPDLRVMACVKSNLAHIPPSLSFRIVAEHLPAINDEVGHVEWAGAVSLTADDLLGPIEESRALDAAKDFLLDYLAAGAVRSNDAKADAKGRGIGQRSLWDAKGELGIIARKDGLGQWLWQLPGDRHASPEAEALQPDRHASTRFNSNGRPSLRSNESLSIYENHVEPLHHVDKGHASPHVDLAPEQLDRIYPDAAVVG